VFSHARDEHYVDMPIVINHDRSAAPEVKVVGHEAGFFRQLTDSRVEWPLILRLVARSSEILP
jgi:hypothetical protein